MGLATRNKLMLEICYKNLIFTGLGIAIFLTA
jgi:hypothetical protein